MTIEPDRLRSVITENLVSDVLSEVEAFEDNSPRIPVDFAYEVVEKTVEWAIGILEDEGSPPLKLCTCASPIHARDLLRGYCQSCGRDLAILIRRNKNE